MTIANDSFRSCAFRGTSPGVITLTLPLATALAAVRNG